MMLRITNGFDRLNDNELIAKVRLIISEMTGNANFPTPNPTLTEVTTTNDEFEAAGIAAETGGSYEKALRDNKKETVVATMHNLGAYVLYTAAGNALVAQSSGFSIAKPPSPSDPIYKAQNLVLEEGDAPGGLKLKFNRVVNARSYMYQYTPDPLSENSVWKTEVGTKRKFVFTGLTSKEKYWVRVVALGINEQQIASDPVSKVVQ